MGIGKNGKEGGASPISEPSTSETLGLVTVDQSFSNYRRTVRQVTRKKVRHEHSKRNHYEEIVHHPSPPETHALETKSLYVSQKIRTADTGIIKYPS